MFAGEWYEDLLDTGANFYKKYEELKNLQKAKATLDQEKRDIEEMRRIQAEIESKKTSSNFLANINMTTLAVISIGTIAWMKMRR